MTASHSTSDPRLGQVLGGRYRVVSVLGTGGMGTVYAAEHVATGQAAAVKMLLPELNEFPQLRRRFEREGRAAGFLQHPNLVEVYELGTDDDEALYLAMELVRGESVADQLERGPIAPRLALSIARQTLLGLDYAHQHGLVHRDLKPENIMVTGARVKLLDFGIVKVLADVANLFGWDKLTRTGVVVGTPRYMAPEQALGRPVDQRADLYSLGVILFEMLTGRPPFESDDSMSLLRMHISTPPPTLAAMCAAASWRTPAMEALVARALAKQPRDRFADAREMMAAVDQVVL